MLGRHNIIHLLSVSECWGGAFPALASSGEMAQQACVSPETSLGSEA